MEIKKIAFGNTEEAFIETRFINGLNIIFSKENNRGKTLLIQGLMYSIGYDAIFPTGFPYKEFYFYSKIKIDTTVFEFLRKNNSVIIKTDNGFDICNSITEFKYFYNQKIASLPSIYKKKQKKLIDLSLLWELFFLGQDKRNTSNLISKGQYNKLDFTQMLFSIKGINTLSTDKYEIPNLKAEIKVHEQKIKELKKKLQILKSNKDIADYSLSSIDSQNYEVYKKILTEIIDTISELKKKRNRETSRKVKLEQLLSELISLNRNIESGKLLCSSCGSDKITFANSEFNFEVSNKHVRDNIIKSIKDNIFIKENLISDYTSDINKEQVQLDVELDKVPPEVSTFLIFKDEILDNKSIDTEISSCIGEIESIRNMLSSSGSFSKGEKEAQKLLIDDVSSLMNKYYKSVSPLGSLVFDSIFTKSGENYSGSEEQEFYFCKILALDEYFEHDYPIIIDAFRSGELSSAKEESMLEIYQKLDKQVILTSTLKDEEYLAEKYNKLTNSNVLDYSEFQDSKILQKSFNVEFKAILDTFEIKI